MRRCGTASGSGYAAPDEGPSREQLAVQHAALPRSPTDADRQPWEREIRAAANPASVDYLYYVRRPDKIHHFFTADDEEFCRKAREYGYSC